MRRLLVRPIFRRAFYTSVQREGIAFMSIVYQPQFVPQYHFQHHVEGETIAKRLSTSMLMAIQVFHGQVSRL